MSAQVRVSACMRDAAAIWLSIPRFTVSIDEYPGGDAKPRYTCRHRL